MTTESKTDVTGAPPVRSSALLGHVEYNFLSLGAGVQSSTLALMAAYGHVTPLPDAAIFADTQAEPDEVYAWLSYLEEQIKAAPHPFPVYRVTAGNLTNDVLRVRHVQSDGHNHPKGTAYMNKMIPVFGLAADGKRTAALGRRCTFDYKIRPVVKKARALAQIRRGQKYPTVTQWIGISYDEIQRMKDPREPWIRHRWPLVDMKMRRKDCLVWMKANGFREPPRSACYYCPFHSDDEWMRIRDNDSKSWQSAIAFDKELRRKFREEDQTLKMEVYLHSSCKPLDEVKLGEPASDQLEWNMQAECEGMCGV
jgi:hypothetical protein